MPTRKNTLNMVAREEMVSVYMPTNHHPQGSPAVLADNTQRFYGQALWNQNS